MKKHPPTEGVKRVGIWIRVSTEDQVRGESPETHEKRARLYAEAKGWEVVEVYRLDALSGKTVKDYPETKRMLADVKRGHITGLVFSKLARLARNTKELLEFADYFREHDADLISLAEAIDTSSPAGRLFYTMIAAMATWEREEISARVAASVPIRAQLGKSTGGAPTFGYRRVDGRLAIDPEEAPIRKLVYELFREHGRNKTVAKMLNDKGYRTRGGARFSDTTVGRLIRDSTAKGVHRANYTKASGDGSNWTLKPESDWVLQEVEPLIDEETWEVCNAILDKRRVGTRPARKAVHLFSGVTYCHCGPKMYVPSNSPKYTCRACRNKIAEEDLEAIFEEELRRFFFSPDEIAAHLEAAHEEIGTKAALLETLTRDRSKLQAEIDKLYDLYQSGHIDKEGFGLKYAPLRDRQAQLDDELPVLHAELDVMKISRLSEAEVIEGARNLYTRWRTLSYEERRQIVEAIVERIEVGVGDVAFTLYYAPPTPGGDSGQAGGAGGDDDSSPSASSQTHGKKATQSQGLRAATS